MQSVSTLLRPRPRPGFLTQGCSDLCQRFCQHMPEKSHRGCWACPGAGQQMSPNLRAASSPLLGAMAAAPGPLLCSAGF